MKSALFLISFLAAICLIWAESPPGYYQSSGDERSEFPKKFRAAFDECIKKHHNINRQRIIEDMKKHKEIHSRRYKCFAACIFKELGYFKGSSIDWEKVKASNAEKYKDPEIVKKANQVVDTCSYAVPKKNSDTCELAGAAVNCCIKESKKMNLPEQHFDLE